MWEEVRGHEQNKTFLQGLLSEERSTPSLLFCGPEGIGKKMLARAFAQSFLCQGNPLEQDECASCRAMRAGTHPDFIQVEQLAPGKELLIEQIKEMAKQAAYAPTLSTHKVCIIDGADFMNATAANSLLKLLEEPPAYWLFILIATDSNKLLPTILSRVMQRPFKGLAVDTIKEILEEKHLENAQLLASLADGSPGKALLYSEAEAPMWRERALYVLENMATDSIMEFMSSLEWLDKITLAEGSLLTEMLMLIFRDGLLLHNGVQCNYYNEDILTRLKACFLSWTSASLEEALTYTQISAKGIASYSGAKSVLEALFIKLNNLQRRNT